MTMPQLSPHASRGVRKLIPITKWADHHDWPTVAGLRWLIANKDTNGFGRTLIKSGRRLLIDEAQFFAWLDAQQTKA